MPQQHKMSQSFMAAQQERVFDSAPLSRSLTSALPLRSLSCVHLRSKQTPCPPLAPFLSSHLIFPPCRLFTRPPRPGLERQRCFSLWGLRDAESHITSSRTCMSGYLIHTGTHRGTVSLLTRRAEMKTPTSMSVRAVPVPPLTPTLFLFSAFLSPLLYPLPPQKNLLCALKNTGWLQSIGL